MNPKFLPAVCASVFARFPEVRGCQPEVQSRPGEQFLLIFRGVSQAADGRKMKHTIRVVAALDGKIIKITSSR